MKRKIMLSSLTIAAAALAVGSGTFAAYHDDETAQDVTVTAGTMDLVVGGDALAVDFSASNAKPGDTFNPNEGYTLTNDGTVDGILHVYLVKDADDENGIGEPETEDGDATADDGELDQYLRVTVDGNGFGGTSILPGLESVNVGERLEISDLIWGSPTHPIQLAAGEQFPAAPFELWFGWSVDPAADDTIQSDSLGFHLEFELDQA
jgi:predicted ribosomally synthesized peptide with SipW-like signal peptide